jgi:prepilin peptidase CpaA
MSIPITIALLLVVVAAGIYDLRVRRIPNWLNLSGLILGIGLNALPGQIGITRALGGLACALAVYIPLYLVRGMGAGDVKLMAAVGSLAGPANWIGIFIVTAILGGIAALALITVKRRFQETVLNVGTLVGELGHRRLPASADEKLDVRSPRALRMPHGTIIAAGSILFLLLRNKP